MLQQWQDHSSSSTAHRKASQSSAQNPPAPHPTLHRVKPYLNSSSSLWAGQ